MYELLCEYAQKFNADFPISAAMKNSNENGVIQLIQKCINTNTAFVAEKEEQPPKAEKKKRTKKAEE